jgi:SagB-type dehydrogenase family enzyme
MDRGIGDEYQERTKYSRGQIFGGLDWSAKPGTYKEYDAEKLDLPSPQMDGGSPFWEVVESRRSVRRFESEALSLADLSQLLWATQGITAERGGYQFRASPSAGALYPIETYVVANDIAQLAPGVYHYWIPGHKLEGLRLGDFRREVAASALDQEVVYHAPCVFIWTAVFQRSKWKYRQRAYRYIYLDAGHIAQNLALASVALGLGSCQIGALYDEEVNDLVGVDGREESAIYMSAIGKPA